MRTTMGGGEGVMVGWARGAKSYKCLVW